jgi:preprotein translocase subunit SecA
MQHEDKQAAYAADITYGTNNEFGFDYLRDNMVYTTGERVQRKLSFAIVDEVDSILIDEARTPLIISGPGRRPHRSLRAHEQGRADARALPGRKWSGRLLGRRERPSDPDDRGRSRARRRDARCAGLLPDGGSLYDASNILMIHHLYAALRAHNLFLKDQQYVVQNGEVIIVDEFTGRLMSGRRWSEGLHQAVEAKEGVRIQNENQTLASITFQNYFRMYSKLSGMTGTADTEAYEFQQIYGLETVVIPTNKPMRRTDNNDQVFRTAQEKHAAIVADIRSCRERGQPVLVGTTSIENSELLSALLDHEKLPHQVLNAKQHAREAEIVIQAGRPGIITIATNMAGRGTDIVLGGSIEKQISEIRDDETLTAADERDQRIAEIRGEWQVLHDQVVASGGLHIIGSERHESRRIDNQLRGRSGRQGDPGPHAFTWPSTIPAAHLCR